MKVKIVTTMLLLLTTIPFITGCSTKKPPAQDLSIAKMAVLEATGDTGSDEATHFLEKSKAELIKAQKLMKKKSYVKAQRMAQKATADARLAKIKAKNALLKKEVDKLDLELKRVKKDFVTIQEGE